MYSAEVVYVTPSKAAEWLAKSEGNPRWKNSKKIVDDKRVMQIVNDIINGDWNPGTNGIGFNEDGVLVEGHHRLTAIIKAGEVVPCLVVHGIKKDGEKHIDDNRSRSEYQRTGVHSRYLAVANVHMAFVNGFGGIRNNLSTEQKLRFLDLHPCIYAVGNLCNKGVHKRNALTMNSQSVHAAMCAYEHGVSETKIGRFFEAVNSGFVVDAGESAAIVLRNQLLSWKNTIKVERETMLSCNVQAAMYDFCNGIPRRVAYKAKRGKYFDMNVATGNRLYTSLWGEA